MITLLSKRLIIRDHIINDLSCMQELLTDKETMRFLPDIYCIDLNAARRNLEVCLAEVNKPKRERYFFALILKESKEYMGEIGFELTQHKTGLNAAHFGYFIMKRFWGQGFTSEAANTVVKFAFDQIQLDLLTTGCFKDNVASEKIMIKCGFKKVAEHIKNTLHEGEWKNRLDYNLSRDEWLKNSP
jgi:[ribosomal protein S5]-alanine N-acetyltransferase